MTPMLPEQFKEGDKLVGGMLGTVLNVTKVDGTDVYFTQWSLFEGIPSKASLEQFREEMEKLVKQGYLYEPHV